MDENYGVAPKAHLTKLTTHVVIDPVMRLNEKCAFWKQGSLKQQFEFVRSYSEIPTWFSGFLHFLVTFLQSA